MIVMEPINVEIASKIKQFEGNKEIIIRLEYIQNKLILGEELTTSDYLFLDSLEER